MANKFLQISSILAFGMVSFPSMLSAQNGAYYARESINVIQGQAPEYIDPDCTNIPWYLGYREPAYDCRPYTNVGSPYLSMATSITDMVKGQQAASPNGAYVLRMQYDGNLVLYRTSTKAPIWSTNTFGEDHYFAYQADGNAVVYNKSVSPRWAYNRFNTNGHFVIQNDGNLVAYRSNGTAYWDSGTFR